jgi:hypothetical protein
MAVECFVFLPGEGSPVVYKFVALPRIGEGITLPGYPGREADFSVVSIEHMAREPKDASLPTVQMHLKAQSRSARRAQGS